MIPVRIPRVVTSGRTGRLALLALAVVLVSSARADRPLVEPGTKAPSADDSNTWLVAPVRGEREARRAFWKEQLDQRGEHWSGLNRYEVLVALDDGEVSEARRLIVDAAGKSGGDDAESSIVLELYSTDVFAPFANELREICDQIVKERRRDGAEPAGWSVRRVKAELLAGYISEHVLGDESGAQEHYRKVGRAVKARAPRSANREELAELSAGAERQLSAIDERVRFRTPKDQ